MRCPPRLQNQGTESGQHSRRSLASSCMFFRASHFFHFPDVEFLPIFSSTLTHPSSSSCLVLLSLIPPPVPSFAVILAAPADLSFSSSLACDTWGTRNTAEGKDAVRISALESRDRMNASLGYTNVSAWHASPPQIFCVACIVISPKFPGSQTVASLDMLRQQESLLHKQVPMDTLVGMVRRGKIRAEGACTLHPSSVKELVPHIASPPGK